MAESEHERIIKVVDTDSSESCCDKQSFHFFFCKMTILMTIITISIDTSVIPLSRDTAIFEILQNKSSTLFYFLIAANKKLFAFTRGDMMRPISRNTVVRKIMF